MSAEFEGGSGTPKVSRWERVKNHPFLGPTRENFLPGRCGGPPTPLGGDSKKSPFGPFDPMDGARFSPFLFEDAFWTPPGATVGSFVGLAGPATFLRGVRQTLPVGCWRRVWVVVYFFSPF